MSLKDNAVEDQDSVRVASVKIARLLETGAGGGGTASAQTPVADLAALKAVSSVGKVGRLAYAMDGAQLRIYRYTTGTTAESSPNVLRPDDYAASTNEIILVVVK